MIQPDIDPARLLLMEQRVLRVAEAARGVRRDVHRVLGRGAVEESLSGLLRPDTLCGGARRSPLWVRDAVLAASGGGPWSAHCRPQARRPQGRLYSRLRRDAGRGELWLC